MALALGTRLGPYEIQAAIGAGGMGEVYQARDTRLDRTVAVKVLPADVAADRDRQGRFEREARAISALDHPHICALYDVGVSDGTHFLVMQHLEGQTLAARLTKGALPLDQALRCAIEIASALDAAHGHGIVHRDLKPANIMLTNAGARLLDFGLAKLRSPVMPNTVSGLTKLATCDPATGGGVLLGTVPYMSPEQVEGRDADPRSDIFGFGAVLYEMVTGRRAFPGATPASVIGAVLKDDPPPVSSTQPLAPPALDHVIRTCLVKEPEERWQHARDLVRELQWIAESGSSPAAGPIRGRTISWPLIAAGTLILGLSVGAWTAARLRPVAIERPFQLQIDPPEGSRFAFGNNVGGIAFSRDGRWVAFVASGNGKTGLWVRSLDSASTRLLPDTEAAAYPFWSPDSKSIGFFAHGKLERIDPDVGPPRVI